jgi:hypothetical protein
VIPSAEELGCTVSLYGQEAIMLTFADRVLGLHLGLGDLQPAPICHGYQNACVCSECLERESAPDVALVPVRQPWETAA